MSWAVARRLLDADFRSTFALECRYAAHLNNPLPNAGKTNDGSFRRTGEPCGLSLPVPEPDLTPQELIARAAALKPLLREQQAENDERGSYSPELHQAFLERRPLSDGAAAHVRRL